MSQGFTIWLTGLPASGKTEVATEIEGALLERGLDAERLDEGELRETYLPSLGVAPADQDGLTRLLGHACHLLSRNGIIAVGAAVSPRQEVRNEIRSRIGRFVEVHVRCPPEVCASRGAGAAGAPYEEPVNPEVVVDTDQEDAAQCAKGVMKTLEIMGWIPKGADSDYNEEDEAKITKRLKDLGYI